MHWSSQAMSVDANNMKDNRIFSGPFEYDPEGDLLAWRVLPMSSGYGAMHGDLIVHYWYLKIPVYFELLNASDYFGFLKKYRKKYLLDGGAI